MLPAEVVLHIFSFLPYPTVYRLRHVCRAWSTLSDRSLYETIKNNDQTVKLLLDRGEQVLLVPHRYDPAHGIIEFRPKEHNSLPENCRWLNPQFAAWKKTAAVDPALPVEDQALVLFHLGFNPAFELRYEIPCQSLVRNEPRFVGDKSLILELLNDDNQTWRVISLRVTPAWLVFGMDASVNLTQIYPERYKHLCNELKHRGADPLLPNLLPESALRFLVLDDPQLSDLSDSKLVAGPNTTRQWQLQEALVSAGLDPLLVWKYGVAKLYISNTLTLSKYDVIQKIQESEANWRRQRGRLMQ
ncbi:hypothetical protein DFQ29_009520 [Apophysomyces sp. BC1021]|nr:hypothetical protein DFQ29_009520 [Apophysomyces sp. BC1021]